LFGWRLPEFWIQLKNKGVWGQARENKTVPGTLLKGKGRMI
jgi:hypothetical protein